MADWANLPLDVLAVIAELLPFREDFIFFRAVCKSWQSVTSVLEKNPSLPPRIPRLMLGETIPTDHPNRSQDIPVRHFWNLLTSKSYKQNMPEICGRRCVGTHYGWLITIGYDFQMSLFHPFSGQLITLPPFSTPYPRKVAMSSNPQNDQDLRDYNHKCVVVAISSDYTTLAFARLGDAVWANISVDSSWYEDIIYYNDRFYAVNCHGDIVVCDLDDENGPRATVVALASSDIKVWYQNYLVESLGDLLLVSRTRGQVGYNKREEGEEEDISNDEEEVNDKKVTYHTTAFLVHKLEECDKAGDNTYCKLTKMTSLGDQALFLGNNVSVSLPSSKYVKANCIYFTEDDCGEIAYTFENPPGYDTGIFNMEERSVELIYVAEFCSSFSPPLWYI